MIVEEQLDGADAYASPSGGDGGVAVHEDAGAPDWDDHDDWEPEPDGEGTKLKFHGLEEVSKAEAEAVLQLVGIASHASVVSVLAEHADFAALHAEHLGDPAEFPRMLQGRGEHLPSVFPASLALQPFWYLQLPSGWAGDVAYLAREEMFDNYCSASPANPWHVAQWLTLRGSREVDECFTARRHLRFDEDVVLSTLHARRGAVNGVVVFFECAGEVVATAYPLDDLLFACLSAGGVASFRRATSDKTVAQLQAETRAVIEGRAVPEQNAPVVEVYTLPREGVPGHWGTWRAGSPRDKVPRTQACPARDAVVGKLPHIMDYLPDELLGSEATWLKVPLPFELGELVDCGGFEVALLRPPVECPIEPEPHAVGLAITGPCFVYRVDFSDAMTKALERTWLSAGEASIVLEQPWSGYPRTVVLDLSDAQSWATEDELERFIDSAPETVDLYVPNVLDAKTWQKQEREGVGHREGTAGGLLEC